MIMMDACCCLAAAAADDDDDDHDGDGTQMVAFFADKPRSTA